MRIHGSTINKPQAIGILEDFSGMSDLLYLETLIEILFVRAKIFTTID